MKLFTSRLPASPKYTGRSKARPTATLSLKEQNTKVKYIKVQTGVENTSKEYIGNISKINYFLK